MKVRSQLPSSVAVRGMQSRLQIVALCLGMIRLAFKSLGPAEKTHLMVAAEYSPFYAIEKGAVLQEARCFNDPHIDSRRCQQVQSRVLELGIPSVSKLVLFRCVAFSTQRP